MTDTEKAARAAGIREAAEACKKWAEGWIDEDGLQVYPSAEWCAEELLTFIDNAPAHAGVRVKLLVWKERYNKNTGKTEWDANCDLLKIGWTAYDEEAKVATDRNRAARIMAALEPAAAGATVQESEKIVDAVWAEYSDSIKEKWTFRKAHVENAVRRALSENRK